MAVLMLSVTLGKSDFGPTADAGRGTCSGATFSQFGALSECTTWLLLEFFNWPLEVKIDPAEVAGGYMCSLTVDR